MLNFIKKINFILILIFLFGLTENNFANQNREFEDADEYLVHQVFFESAKYVKPSKVKEAYNKFITNKMKYNYKIIDELIKNMDELEFSKFKYSKLGDGYGIYNKTEFREKLKKSIEYNSEKINKRFELLNSNEEEIIEYAAELAWQVYDGNLENSFTGLILDPNEYLRNKKNLYYSIKDEKLLYASFYSNIDFMKKDNAKKAIVTFLDSVIKRKLEIEYENINKMNDADFQSLLKEINLPLNTTKEQYRAMLDNKLEKMIKNFEQEMADKNNDEIKKVINSMTKTIEDSSKRSFLVGAIIGGGVVSVAAVVTVGYFTKEFLKTFWNKF